jgi:hypothetical protein
MFLKTYGVPADGSGGHWADGFYLYSTQHDYPIRGAVASLC